jgi:hypothetical protein
MLQGSMHYFFSPLENEHVRAHFLKEMEEMGADDDGHSVPRPLMRVNLRPRYGFELAGRGRLETSEDEGVFVLH